MSDIVLVAVITALGVILAAGITGYFTLMTKLRENSRQMDGRLTELLNVTKQLAHQEGIEIGTESERVRVRQRRAELASDKVGGGDVSNLAADTEAARSAPPDQGRTVLP